MNDIPVTVIGYFFGFDGSNQISVKGRRVELMDSDADGVICLTILWALHI